MVRQLTTILGKEVMTFLECIYHISELGYGNTTNLAQLLNIF